MRDFDLLPAVDVKDGRAVRLVQGEISKESIYGAPLDVALDFAYFTSGGKDIPAPAVSGNYKIRVDFQTGKYTISKI